jgi:hypothetical protein
MYDSQTQLPTTRPGDLPWNKGKLTGAKPPLQPKHGGIEARLFLNSADKPSS